MADLLAQVAADEFGAAQVSEVEPVMCGEDFAYYLRRVPGAFALLGIGNRPHPHHSARFDIDEAVLPLGVRLFARLVLE
jgi:amidohydrolase